MSRLVIFLSLYFSVYGLLHLYVLIKLRRAFYLQGLGYMLLTLLLLFFMMAPVQSRILEAQGYGILSIISAWIGFLWMGFVFLFICIFVVLDGYQLIIAFGQRITNGDLTHLMLSRRQYVAFAAIVTACLMIYGGIEARQLQIETLMIKSAKISPSRGRVRIVQISDLHMGPMLYPGRVASIVEAIQAAQPDMLVSTGDFVDGQVHRAADVANMFKSIKTPMGKLAVTGNHEFYANVDQAVRFTREAGFTVLRGERIAVGKQVTVVGVDDPAGGAALAADAERELLAKSDGNRFILLLKHRPIVDPVSEDRFDLQLSGHVHKGQIFPFTLLIKLRYAMCQGMHRLKSGSRVYVSRGAGTWGPPIRLLATPEITIIDLLPAKKASKK